MFVDGSERWGLILWFGYGCEWCFMDCFCSSTCCNLSRNKQPCLSAEAEASGQIGLPESGRGNPARPQPIPLA